MIVSRDGCEKYLAQVPKEARQSCPCRTPFPYPSDRLLFDPEQDDSGLSATSLDSCDSCRNRRRTWPRGAAGQPGSGWVCCPRVRWRGRARWCSCPASSVPGSRWEDCSLTASAAAAAVASCLVRSWNFHSPLNFCRLRVTSQRRKTRNKGCQRLDLRRLQQHYLLFPSPHVVPTAPGSVPDVARQRRRDV